MNRLVVAALCLLATPTWADTYDYTCKANGKSLPLKVDDAKKVLIWKGKSYAIAVQEDCAKFGWRAERPGAAFDFCTATQGYAEFTEEGSRVQCDQIVR